MFHISSCFAKLTTTDHQLFIDIVLYGIGYRLKKAPSVVIINTNQSSVSQILNKELIPNQQTTWNQFGFYPNKVSIGY